MNSKFILSFVLLAAIGVGIFLLTQDGTPPPIERTETPKVGEPSAEEPKAEEPAEEEPKTEKPEVCIQLYDPVCGTDGKTYSNSCFAGMAEMEVMHKGECETSDGSRSQEVSELPRETAVAIIADGSFAPQTVQVNKGTKITWINHSTRSVWPASGAHPTHQLYPGFDALRGIKPGDRYSFKFDRVGVWKYHDHLNASVTGTIEVME